MDFFKDIENNLINFQKPARYIGNEIGIPKKDFINSPVKFAISYPDIYEIGMSNQGIKILYDRINKLNFASCERVFSPWTDFEKFLIDNNIPLFSLESKTPLVNFDFIGISIQYELLLTNFLNILKLGKIEILSKKRKKNDPIVICGGPCVVNPEPYSPFADLFLIGEAEDTIEKFLAKYKSIKGKFKRNEIIRQLSEIPGIYSPVYSKDKIKIQHYKDFNENSGILNHIIPNINVIQNKLVVEIMRGCPNKCRFCQAGVIYKPYREKPIKNILNEIINGVNSLGINEVTLSSLSSGDYSEILLLTNYFTKLFNEKNISFSLPSIRIESFDKKLLNKISSVRKSGLTFAVEAGSREGQISINKPIDTDKILSIISYAVQHGWKLIKLYFMIGLPGVQNEADQIISFVDKILELNKKITINLNIATFVPKPHTPYQYEQQLSLEESLQYIHYIEYYYKKSRVKIKKHNPYASYIEGFIARGDKKVGLAVYHAFKNGAKFDGWKEGFKYKIYKQAFNKNKITYEKYLSKKDHDIELPWDNIDIGLSKKYLIKELENSKKKISTKNCKDLCEKECTICDDKTKKIDYKNPDTKTINKIIRDNTYKPKTQNITRYFLEFSKTGFLKFISHIDTIKYFERLFQRSGIPILFTQGFNPHPKFQFSSALPLGIESSCEILEFYITQQFDTNELYDILIKYQHNNMPINKIRQIDFTEKISLMESAHFTDYSLYFNPKYFKTLKKIFNNYQKNEIKYNFYKKDILFEGKYKDFLEFFRLENDRILVKYKNVRNIPNIIFSVKDIFKNLEIFIKKEKIYNLKCKELIELLYI
jgi:radical SAM-linked protein